MNPHYCIRASWHEIRQTPIFETAAHPLRNDEPVGILTIDSSTATGNAFAPKQGSALPANTGLAGDRQSQRCMAAEDVHLSVQCVIIESFEYTFLLQHGGIGVSLPQERCTAEQVFYTWVARSRSGSSSFTASALNKLSSPPPPPPPSNPHLHLVSCTGNKDAGDKHGGRLGICERHRVCAQGSKLGQARHHKPLRHPVILAAAEQARLGRLGIVGHCCAGKCMSVLVYSVLVY